MSICEVGLDTFVIKFEPLRLMLGPGDVMSRISIHPQMVHYAIDFEPDTLNSKETFIDCKVDCLLNLNEKNLR